MPRTLVAFALAAALLTSAWLGLETRGVPLGEVLLTVALALLPTLAAAVSASRRLVAFALAASALIAAGAAFGLPLSDARPWSGEHDFFGPVLSSFRQGFLEFFDTRVPFDRVDFPLMHGVILLALFGFLTAAGIAIAARRPLVAAAAVVVGVGWPATMSSAWIATSRPLATGALVLVSVLAFLFLLKRDSSPVRGLAQAAWVAIALVALSLAASTSDAVAKRGFVSWQRWDFYDRPDDPVSVAYVWDANYDGIRFPEKETVVLKIRVPGPRRSLYWRATTLDEYTGQVWREDPDPIAPPDLAEEIRVAEVDPLLPRRARSEDDWIRQEVEVKALEDNHLVGSAQPVRWEPGTSSPVTLLTNGGVLVAESLRDGQRYTAWSYVPQVSLRELGAAGTDYPDEARRYLRVSADEEVEPLPAFGTLGRDAEVARFFEEESYLVDHRRMYSVARRVSREARSPYEAVVLLESWFRGAEGGFIYDESPPVTGAFDAPLLAFLGHKRGYCQHFAGAMALMLRYLGIPARVAAGFTSGSYDEGEKEWTVTDHNAHTWVEVYFPRFGWIPFDPTPNRGQLSAAYTPFSPGFDAAQAAGLAGPLLQVPEIAERVDRAAGLAQREPGADAGGGGGVPGAVAEAGRSFVLLLLLVVGIAVAALLLLKELRRRFRFLARDPRALASAYRRDLVGFVADQGVRPAPSATLAELGDLVERHFAVDSAPFVRAVSTARFGPLEESRAATGRARRELRRLRRRMSASLDLRQRVRGALSVRSLAA